MQGQGGPNGAFDVTILPDNSCLVENTARGVRLSSLGGRLFADEVVAEEEQQQQGDGSEKKKQHRFVVVAAAPPMPGGPGPVLSVGGPPELDVEAHELSEAQKRAFIKDGFLRLPGLVPPAITQAALKEINAALYSAAVASANNGEKGGGGGGKGGGKGGGGNAKGSNGGAMRAGFNDEGVLVFSTTPALTDLLFCSGAWGAAQSLLGKGKALRPAGAQVGGR
jgi:hypothetical protein